MVGIPVSTTSNCDCRFRGMNGASGGKIRLTLNFSVIHNGSFGLNMGLACGCGGGGVSRLVSKILTSAETVGS